MMVDSRIATNLKHGQEQVLLAAFVLISINCEHDSLQQGIYLGHGNKATEVGDMPWFGLEKEK